MDMCCAANRTLLQSIDLNLYLRFGNFTKYAPVKHKNKRKEVLILAWEAFLILIKNEIMDQRDGSMDNALVINCEDCSSVTENLYKC